ncbi:MAG: baseplate J/gp47 family protein [Clostridia bacterium]|nr:baseplate J/gp47 family protein [Clostridia bacterium]
MFETYTYEYILNEMLDSISDDLDKREGSVIYNAIAPAAMKLSENYRKMENIIAIMNIDTANGEYLDNLTKQFGIERKEATYAIKKGLFYDKDNQLMNVEIGKRFSIDNYIYSVYEKIDTGTYQMKCEILGNGGNIQSGNLLPIDYISGLATAKLTDLLIPAVDEETDEELRDRFYSSVNSVAFGGNIADYKEKTKEIEGVGAVKVIPVWNGGGTVKVIILDSSLNVASNTLLENVENAIGENGDGIAPIGHTVTTVSADKENIYVSCTITLDEDYTIETITGPITNAIENYLKELKEEWENTTSLTVRIAHIESRILNVSGVVDISNTMINNSTGNLIVGNEKIPYLENLQISEVE